MTASEEKIYKKVAETLKLTGSGEVRSISVSTFKGKEDCKKRLEQLADHLDDSLRIDYNKTGANSYSVLISGFPCDLTMPGGVNRLYSKAYWDLREPGDEWGSFTKTAASISREYKLDQKEVEIFLRALPLVAEDPLKKDDFWGWMYRCGCDCEDFCWEVIFAALIAPDCKDNVVKTVIDDYVNTSYWDGNWWQSEPSK